MKKHNFYAGPAILPQTVLEQAAKSVHNFADMDLSILEISHRSKQFEAVMDEAARLVHELTGLGDDYAVLFLSGGASSQFFMVPMNLCRDGEKICYVNTGTWASGAIKEARLFGNVEVLASSEDDHFRHIPKGYSIPSDAAYLHLTSNNTIYGSQFHAWPDCPVSLVCDMSSDIFSRRLDFSKFDLIYAGAQKNMGPAGVTLVIVKKSLLGRSGRKLPTMLDYRTHADKGSMYNTPPVFSIYVSMLTMKWIVECGGLEAIEKRNEDKAGMLYTEIDRNSCFTGTVRPEDRSRMNVVFIPVKSEFEKPFLESCRAAGCVGLEGHRSVGGFRASLYNALELSSVEVLVSVMKDFEAKNG
ncbi:MAG: 3-phosphoserine/phosphohydroxythreonine transaminase [Saprospiraceae bacterium]|nr:3-phosphoserine/phosphohydroxythreonine transaminase [Saprospiraceae bacterium]HMW38471.1 3-phosphoserine/phosphohydroxythreonine transaminase [Saprospiraceae bacterium]HMX87559.1 3-phosphoserine/phosphohydroxythreonine transaminase [Saprospiraceae bacterium]HMZ39563.1 3-phosphoserine/phosphohydroxythreonine transaminase [Saprospiraceae bacterium]HNA64210.1 3-phosphoserine/phosphohydroxythreonine transaminase [Saprospiraceae bacterium]